VAPSRTLSARGRTLRLGGRPWLMGVVNASPDSFSGSPPDPLEAGRALLAEGADIVDVGGESARTDRPAVSQEEELARVIPVVEVLAAEGALVSVDTYKPPVADAAVAAGAAIVNDVSGLRDPALAEVCARTGAALVLVHTPVPPKVKGLDTPYADVAGEVAAFLAGRMEVARERGVAPEQLALDPGPDLGKDPARTIALLRELESLHRLGRPLVAAVSRKDFVGALTGRAPRDRLGGTLAALAHAADAGAHVLRVHDVAAAADFLAVRAALRGEAEVPGDLRLAPELRRDG
jgi:dihydropteroate synthase